MYEVLMQMHFSIYPTVRDCTALYFCWLTVYEIHIHVEGCSRDEKKINESKLRVLVCC